MANNTYKQNQVNSTPQDNKGGLVVSVTTASNTRPIMNAHVVISKRNASREQLIRTLTTDASGRTPVIELPTPPLANSTSPGSLIPYSIYNVRVDYPGYYSVENLDVPIFPNNVAVQPVNLIPLPLDTYTGKTKFFNEIEPSDLIEEESGGRQWQAHPLFLLQ